MAIKQILIFLVYFTAIQFVSCKEELLVVIPPPYSPDSSLYIKSISHSSIHNGEKILVKINNIVHADLHFVHLNNEYVFHKEESDSVVSVFIPYRGTSGKLKFVYTGRIDTIIYSDSITVIQDCMDSLCISWNSGEKINELDSKFTDMISTRSWELDLRSDTLFFKLNGNCGDECSFTRTLVFLSNEDNQLPAFLFSSLTETDPYGRHKLFRHSKTRCNTD